MMPKIKICILLSAVFSGWVSAQKYNHTDSEKIIVDNTVTSEKYGIKDISGNWVLKPSYYFIEDFYDNELNAKDSVAVFYDSKFYKNSNIFLGNKCGLISEKGKIIIPGIYDKLICYKGSCAATSDNKTYIIDYQNNKKEEFEGKVKYYKDSLLILENKQNNYYVRNLRLKKFEGPFYEAKILNNKNIYYTADKNERTFHRLNGELLLTSDEIAHHYDDNFFADDVYIAYKNPRMFFKNLKGKIFYQSFDDISINKSEIFEICPGTQSGGDYRYCPTKKKLTIFDILKGLGEIDGFNNNMYGEVNFDESAYDRENIPLYNIVRKNNSYALANSKGEIISEFYTVLKPSFLENEDTFYFEKNINGKIQSGIIEDGRETLKTNLKVLHFLGNNLLVSDRENNKLKIISKEKEITVSENLAAPTFAGIPIESNLYTLQSQDTYVTVNPKGKLKHTKFSKLSNFYRNYAFAMTKQGDIHIINEKLKSVNTLKDKSYISDNVEINKNGNTIFENKENRNNQFLINYKGEIIIDKNNAEIARTNDYLYQIRDINYNYGGYTFVDKNGKPFYGDGENLINCRIFRRKNYFYIRVDSRNYGPDFYFFDNLGQFLGKNLPLYKQTLKDY
ncbi:hypothetical protein [Chryseobacterium shigense]|uniref:WG containing repeat-containing protein n=1 Tax=Chryseobacterium shigense TaxID=297244 RepID=A0A841N1Y0_9FLAO|nr:hypothetical protein [Chryseobacterium shigense]MBB6370874.1 hypothetical protein [Chryseobacterium shigense]